MNVALPRGRFEISKNTVSIGSHYINKFVEKEIPTSFNKFNCLNIDKDVVISNDVNDNDLSNNKKSDKSRDLIKTYRQQNLKFSRIRNLLQDCLLFQAK